MSTAVPKGLDGILLDQDRLVLGDSRTRRDPPVAGLDNIADGVTVEVGELFSDCLGDHLHQMVRRERMLRHRKRSSLCLEGPSSKNVSATELYDVLWQKYMERVAVPWPGRATCPGRTMRGPEPPQTRATPAVVRRHARLYQVSRERLR